MLSTSMAPGDCSFSVSGGTVLAASFERSQVDLGALVVAENIFREFFAVLITLLLLPTALFYPSISLYLGVTVSSFLQSYLSSPSSCWSLFFWFWLLGGWVWVGTRSSSPPRTLPNLLISSSSLFWFSR